jgi:hypothetical protein
MTEPRLPVAYIWSGLLKEVLNKGTYARQRYFLDADIVRHGCTLFLCTSSKLEGNREQRK